MVAQTADSKRDDKRKKRKSLLRLTEAQVVLGWLVVLALIALLGTIYLIQTSHTATTGRMVQDLQFDLVEIKRINSELERDIAESQSLKRLQTDAEKYGFIKARPDNIDYLIVANYPQGSEIIPEQSAQPSEPFADFRSALIKYISEKASGMVRGESP